MVKDLIFILAGLLGVLIHCFIEMGKINKQLNGDFKIGPYLKLERFNIVVSVLAVIACALCSDLIKKLVQADYYLTPGFLCVGYFGQSIVTAAFGKAADTVKKLTGQCLENNP